MASTSTTNHASTSNNASDIHRADETENINETDNVNDDASGPSSILIPAHIHLLWQAAYRTPYDDLGAQLFS
jgi:hypothetical protein